MSLDLVAASRWSTRHPAHEFFLVRVIWDSGSVSSNSRWHRDLVHMRMAPS